MNLYSVSISKSYEISKPHFGISLMGYQVFASPYFDTASFIPAKNSTFIPQYKSKNKLIFFWLIISILFSTLIPPMIIKIKIESFQMFCFLNQILIKKIFLFQNIFNLYYKRIFHFSTYILCSNRKKNLPISEFKI